MNPVPHRRALAAVTLLAACAIAPAPARAASQETVVRADPHLQPGFDPAIHDYVSRCGIRKFMRLTVEAPSGKVSKRVRLREGRRFGFTVRSGSVRERYRVRCLPPSFPTWTSERSGPTQAQWYLVTPHEGSGSRFVAMFDSNGVPVWWRHTQKTAPIDAKLLPNGRLAWSRYYGEWSINPRQGYEQHALDGRKLSSHRAAGTPTDTHDFLTLPNGNVLLFAYRPRDAVDLQPYGGPADATVLDAEIQEQTPDGEVVWSWSSRDHIDLEESNRWWPRIFNEPEKLTDGRTAYDLVHINSAALDGEGLVISTRYTDAVYRIDRATGAVVWKLGGTLTPERLAVTNDPYGQDLFGGQHDARVLSDGTVTVYDNRTVRTDPQPRAVRYSINPVTRVATLLEQLTDPTIEKSGYAGGTRKLPGGNWVTAWGGSPYITEQRPSGKTVFRLKLRPDKWTYRAFPIPFGELSAARLRRAMDRMYAPGD